MSTPSDRTAAGRLSRQLLDVKPAAARRRRPSEGPLRILHLLSQQPGKTGSGVALLAMVRHGAEAGYRQHAVIGIPGEEPLPGIPPLAPDEITAVRFDRPPVPFPVPGMSDIMPYRSTRFSTFTELMRAPPSASPATAPSCGSSRRRRSSPPSCGRPAPP
ncbi:MAG: hypothetical protein MUF46_00205 [Desulfobacterales bacterium]|nr:hypothetical protein [Desulfobacterales bacterium]